MCFGCGCFLCGLGFGGGGGCFGEIGCGCIVDGFNKCVICRCGDLLSVVFCVDLVSDIDFFVLNVFV